ncbi:MAG: DUF1853 family protein [Burkholderiaceae bacterium]|nr:DUF1853 family protein [Burkholderiaceae bacterium]
MAAEAAHPPAGSCQASSCQANFRARWPSLRDPHVRSLAWLLDAPDLLDPQAPRWAGRIASLPADAADACRDWLLALDAEPAALHDYLGVHRFTRLGRHAESLLAWYFRHRGVLVAHGLQVRSGKEETVGEFDFLLRQGDALVHWEFATKFYLLNSDDPALAAVQQADYFVGPNLSDTLGRKIRKILERQLKLGEHPAAQPLLPQPLAAAQALLKGWLFYRRGEQPPLQAVGISAAHCRGWWCTLRELDTHLPGPAAVLPRMAWLAPVRLPQPQVCSAQALRAALAGMFGADRTPVMVATLAEHDGAWVETERGFVVPDEWPEQAQRPWPGT